MRSARELLRRLETLETLAGVNIPPIVVILQAATTCLDRPCTTLRQVGLGAEAGFWTLGPKETSEKFRARAIAEATASGDHFISLEEGPALPAWEKSHAYPLSGSETAHN